MEKLRPGELLDYKTYMALQESPESVAWGVFNKAFYRPMNDPPKSENPNDLILGLTEEDIAWLWTVENSAE